MDTSVRTSAKFISSVSQEVKIKESGIQNLGDVLIAEVKSGQLSPNNFSQTEVHPKSGDPWALDWLFVIDTLNFCFWHNENEEGWKVDGYTGYFALCSAVNRAQKEKIDILNPKFYSVITEDQLRKILRSDTKIECPLLSERVKCLHEVGNVLLENFNGTFENVVKKAESSAVNLLQLILDNFKCFRDEAVYKGHKVTFYKRAQILIGDIWACFKNKGIGYFPDIAKITAFADYRVPQVLLWHGIFEYSDGLLKRLNANEILPYGDEAEVEIRGCTIHAVELLNKYASKILGEDKINSVLIDHFLWDMRRKHSKEILDKGLPFHKTFSIYY